MVQKIMERESALKVIGDIKNKLGGVDLDELCGEEVEIKADEEDETIHKRLVQGVQCGLVYWDEDAQCLTQELIAPVKSGEVTLDKLCYKNKLRLKHGRNFNAKNQAALTIESLAVACCRPTQVIEQITGQDIQIAIGCLRFFDK